MKLSEIRSYISALEGSRVNFVTRHANDARVVQAILDGPPFLSGLSEGDIGIIKTQVAKRVAPKITEAKEKTIQARMATEGNQKGVGAMPKPSGHETDAARQKDYRRGYRDGVAAMISVLVDKLSYAEKEKLDHWFIKELSKALSNPFPQIRHAYKQCREAALIPKTLIG